MTGWLSTIFVDHSKMSSPSKTSVSHVKGGLEQGQTGDQLIKKHLCSTYSVPDAVLSTLQIQPYLILTRTLGGSCYYYPHFRDEYTKNS